MSRDMAFEMQEMFLSMRSLMRNVVPIKVTFGRKVFYGCRLTEVHQYTPNERAVTEGKVKAGDEYTRQRIELIGTKPEKMKNRARFVFTYEGKEWYIGCWYPHNDRNEWHPFGATFTLFDWDVPNNQKIDEYDLVKRPRIPMTVTNQE